MKNSEVMYIPYMVYHVELNQNNEVFDVFVSDVNKEFLDLFEMEEDIIGKSFKEVFPNIDFNYKDEFYKCAYKKEKGNGFSIFLNQKRYEALPCNFSLEDGYCGYVFINTPKENKTKAELRKAYITDDIIIRIAKIVNSDTTYSIAMQEVIKGLGLAINSDRVYILEADGLQIDNTFEYCKDGVAPAARLIQSLPLSIFSYWLEVLKKNKYIEITNIDEVKDIEPYLYTILKQNNVNNLFAYPLYSEGKLIGFLSVDNCNLESMVDARKIIEDASHFIASRVSNNILVKRLEKASKYDTLTGLFNRYGFNEAVREFFENNINSTFVYAVMDIDEFKTINDLYGHPAGDVALSEFAKSLNNEFGEKAIIGRTGGDEFCLVLKVDSIPQVEYQLKNFVQTEMSYLSNDHSYPFTVSLGYALYPLDGQQINDLYFKADTALYYVKFHSKNDCGRYNSQMMLGERQRIGFSMREITSNVPGVIFIYEAESGQIMYANDDCVRMFDCKDIEEFLEYVKYNFRGIVYAPDYERVDRSIWQQINSGKTENRDYVEYRILTKTGRIKHVRDLGRLVYDERYGHIFYVLLINVDGNDL